MIPSGLTETQMVQTIDKVMGALANKFRFDIHAREDIIQEGRMIAWKVIVEKYDGKRPLENFLRVHLRNRIINFKRDNSRHVNTVYMEGEPLGETESTGEIEGKINRELPVELRGDYLQFKEGVKLPKYKRDRLIEALREILKDYDC